MDRQEALDVALGIGGLPSGRIVETFGPDASGKTTLVYQPQRTFVPSDAATYLSRLRPGGAEYRVLESDALGY